MLNDVFKPVLLAFMLAFSLAAAAADTPEALIKQRIEAQFPRDAIKSVLPAPYPGLYEVVVGRSIVYTDAKVSVLFVGSLIDPASKANLTQARLQEVNKVDVASLPLALAIRTVKGSGKRQLVVFSDPDCPFCKKLEKESLAGVTDVTIYTFLLPLEKLHPDAPRKSALVWCAQDRARAWAAAMVDDTPLSGDAKCETPAAQVAELAKALHIDGTPALIFPDGRMVPGAISKEQIEQRLTSVK